MNDQVNLSGQDYAAHVQQNQDYYLRQFRKFSVDGFKFTWNWAAFLLPFAWPAYRRMYGWTIVSPLLFVILYWISLIKEYEYSSLVLLMASLLPPGLLLGLFGNYLYFLKMRSAVRKRTDASVTMSGPDTTMNGAAVALILCWGAALVYLGVSVPPFAAYRFRAYENQAMIDLRKCRTSFEEFFADRMRYPIALEEAGCAHDPRVVLGAPELVKDRFGITAYHAKGSKEYLTLSDGPGVFTRAKGSAQEWAEQR